jgi:hypothetical protein
MIISCAKMSHCSDVLLGGNDPLCAFTKMPVQSCDVKNVETMRCLRLTQQAVDPISFILPRSNALKEYFHDDIYRDCRAPTSGLSVSGWLENTNKEPVRESLQVCCACTNNTNIHTHIYIYKYQIRPSSLNVVILWLM